MTDALLPLIIVTPLLAATLPLALGLRWSRIGWSVAAGTTLVTLALAAALARAVFAGGPIVHALGGFAGPVGIELVADELSALVVLLIAVVALAVLPFARIAGPRGAAFYSGYLLLTGGLFGLSLTGDLFNLFVFLEIVGLATYALVASSRSGEAAYAALKYLFVGTVGASLYLIGVGYAFMATGTLNMADMRSSLASVGYSDPLVQAAFGFILAGLAVKTALYPLHTWQPDAYQEAPDSVTAFIAALVSTVAAYAVIRIVYTVFTPAFLAANPLITDATIAVGSVSIIAGSVLAAAQSDVKRMFAYSSVAQFGMIVVAALLANTLALLGAVIHLIGHGLLKGGLFLSVGILREESGAETVRDYAMLGEQSPLPASALAVLALALVGVPPSVGFLGKWYMILGAVEAGHWPVAALIIASTLLTLLYVTRLLSSLYFAGYPNADEETRTDDSTPATDGGTPDGDDVEEPADETDDGTDADGIAGDAVAESTGVSRAALLVAALFAAAAIGLGFAGAGFETMLDPFMERVL